MSKVALFGSFSGSEDEITGCDDSEDVIGLCRSASTLGKEF
jgi:hypothetical protein